MKKCVFAGTFDPFTVGHEDTVKKSLLLFDEVIIAVAENRQKNHMFSSQARAEMIRAVFAEETKVRVLIWDGVIADLLERENTPFYVRGVRNTVDFEYENDDLYASKDISPNIIAIYFPSEKAHTHVSSSLVKNCIAFGKPFENYVPAAVYEYIRRNHNVPKAD